MAVAVAAEPDQWPCDRCNCQDGRSPESRWGIPDVIDKTDRCFRKLVTRRSWQLIGLYPHYKNGFLPVAGGLLDQPNSFLRDMSTIDEWMNKRDR